MLIVVDKPMELTSFDVVKRMKHVFPWEKIWHSGTLDPKATGLMILGVGKWTKKLTELIGLDKVYETVMDFSKMSDTWDMGYREKYEEYEVIHQGSALLIDDNVVSAPSLEQIDDLLQGLIPEYELPLPAFSAKKKDGKRLYKMARSGKEISETKIMKLKSFDILDYQFPEVSLRLEVGSWTYIRSIWYWLGQQCWLWGILTSLRRTSLGKRNLSELILDQEVDYTIRRREWNFRWCVIEE